MHHKVAEYRIYRSDELVVEPSRYVLNKRASRLYFSKTFKSLPRNIDMEKHILFSKKKTTIRLDPFGDFDACVYKGPNDYDYDTKNALFQLAYTITRTRMCK
jgi:hypothetical protein